MSNWKEENIKNRMREVDERIAKIKDDAEKNEAVIREIESEEIAVYGLDSSFAFVDGKQILTRGCLIVSGEDVIRLRVGVSGIGKGKETAYVEITGKNDFLKYNIETKEKEVEIVTYLLGELALDTVIAVSHAIELYLLVFKEEYLAAKAKSKEFKSEI